MRHTRHDPQPHNSLLPRRCRRYLAGTGRGRSAHEGILLIDACSDASCEVVDFNEARIFQMYSDGKTTHFQLFAHPERSNTAPPWNDSAWYSVTERTVIGAGTYDEQTGLVTDPTITQAGPDVSRYFRVNVQNDGSVSEQEGHYIELHALKLFSLSAPEQSPPSRTAGPL